jgi:integrase/recombinase XerD
MNEANSIPMKDPTTYIDFEECLAMENSATGRDKIVLGLLWRCGLRSFECARMQKNSFYLNKEVPEDSYIKVLGKGNRWDLVPISIDFLPALEEYLKDYEGDDYIFGCTNPISRRTVFNIVRRHSKLAGILSDKGGRAIHPHTLRHSLAIFLVKSGVPIPKVQQILRHSSLTSTTFYLKFSTKDRAEAYQEAFSKKIGETI